MPLGKIQTQIVAHLVEAGRLTPEQRDTIAARPEDLTGDTLDRLLQDEHRITSWQLLVAKARVLGLAPWNVARQRTTTATVGSRCPSTRRSLRGT